MSHYHSKDKFLHEFVLLEHVDTHTHTHTHARQGEGKCKTGDESKITRAAASHRLYKL